MIQRDQLFLHHVELLERVWMLRVLDVSDVLKDVPLIRCFTWRFLWACVFPTLKDFWIWIDQISHDCAARRRSHALPSFSEHCSLQLQCAQSSEAPQGLPRLQEGGVRWLSRFQ